MDNSEPLPFYLVVDMSEPPSRTRKRDLFLEIVDGLSKAPPFVQDVQVVLMTFADKVRAMEPIRLGELRRPPEWIFDVGHRRRYVVAFEGLQEMIAARRGDTVRTRGPLVLFVTDGLDQDAWEGRFREFVDAVNPTVIPIVHDAVNFPPCCPSHPRQHGLMVPRRAVVSEAVVEEVLRRIEAARSPDREQTRSVGRPVGSAVSDGRGTTGSAVHQGVPVVVGSAAARHDDRVGAAHPTMRMTTASPAAGDDYYAGEPADDARPSDGAAGRASPSEEPTRQLPLVSDELPPARWTPDPEPTGPQGDAEKADLVDDRRTLPDAPEWEGSVTPFVVGEPGAAADVRALPDPDEWNRNDTVCDGVEILGRDDQAVVDVRAASSRGRSHRYYGTVRQDDYAYRRTDDRRFLICAVSDGVSSGRLSHRAAIFVTRQGCELISRQLRDKTPRKIDWAAVVQELARGVIDIGTRLIERGRAATDAEEVTSAEVARQMAATAVFAVVELEASAAALPVHVCTIGDSSAWVLRGGARWAPLNEVKNGTSVIATSKTSALPLLSSEPPEPVMTTIGPDDVLVLMTDGIGDALRDGAGPVGRFLAEKWRRPPMALEFAAQVDFTRRSHDDDRTAVAVWPAGSS